MTLLRRLVRRWRALAREPLPLPVSAAMRLHLLDAIGVGLAASRSTVGQPWMRFGSSLPPGSATMLGVGRGAPPAQAALVNGGLVHGLEYDDTHTGSIVHGSAVLATTALAAGQAHAATGADVLRAYALGWEALVRIGLAAPGSFQAQGFMVTAIGGAIVAAIMAADMAGLDEDAVVGAGGIALSQASGNFEFLANGSSVKSLQPGWAALAGLTAAALAGAGLTGPDTALDGRHSLFALFARDASAAARFDALLDDLGVIWQGPDAAFKLLPCCHYIHPFVEAAGMLGVGADEIAAMTLLVSPGAAPVICEPWAAHLRPSTPHAARWSLPIVVAACLVEGRVDLQTFERPASDAVLALAGRMHWKPLPDAGFPARFAATVRIRTRDGRDCEASVPDVRGGRTRPVSDTTIRAKFDVNAACASHDPASLAAAVLALDNAPNLDRLRNALEATSSKATQ